MADEFDVPNDPKLESCIAKVMAQGGHDKSSAIAICRSAMNMSTDDLPNQRYAFEPFASVQDVLSGRPIKIMPIGTFYRGERKLDITAGDLQQIADNTKAGLPRFRIPINENHSGVGKVGTVSGVEYNETGAEGPGLYATAYELTDEGKKLVEQKRFDAVSPEIIWTKNGGAKYQDPQTGRSIDNVLVGLALTDRPFFGHDNVALFSALPTKEHDDMAEVIDPKPKRKNGYTALKELMRQKFDEMLAMVTDNNGDGEADAPNMPMMPKGKMMPEVEAEIETATADTPADKLALSKVEGPQGENMADTITTPKPESFNVTAEEFAALKAKADEAAKLQEQFAALKSQSEQFATQLLETKRARRRDQLVAHCENFSAIPDKAETLAEKLQALEEKDPELFAYFDGLLNTVNNQINTAGLFSQMVSARKDGSVESFEAVADKILKDKFGGDMAKYTDALGVAAKERPDLFAIYNETYAPSRK